MSKAQRATIFEEDARVVEHQGFAGGQYILRLHAPRCAVHARAGQFVHVRCAPNLPMRRPLSIMNADPRSGQIELLYKVVGSGLRALSGQTAGRTLSVLGPIGTGFQPVPGHPGSLLIGGGVGIPPLLFMARQLATEHGSPTVAFFGSEIPFPFDTVRGGTRLAGIPPAASHNLAELEQAGVAGRLASAAGFNGCYPGYVTDLARDWLRTLKTGERMQYAIYACGPEPMLRSVQALAREYGLPSRLCLEEFMACGVGGCAGCAVRLETDTGPVMKRVCVDGPVFDGYAVYPD